MLQQYQLKEISHWIFDMDGTLTISQHDFEFIRSKLGLPSQVPILEALHDMPESQAEPLWLRLNELEEHFAEKSSLMHGAVELLEKLSVQGAELAVLTRNTMPVVEKTLQACGLEHFFPVKHRLDRDSCTPKPSPDGIHQLLALWNADANNAVMVGDYLYDLQAGKSAGVTTIHLDTGRGVDWPEYTDIKVNRLAEIEAMI
ncbi:MAG: HAD family hydrolase [Gammaproteobacteria bacterium]|nr:HAD family hydrolase [Gammaproteobacteria bacterium]